MSTSDGDRAFVQSNVAACGAEGIPSVTAAIQAGTNLFETIAALLSLTCRLRPYGKLDRMRQRFAGTIYLDILCLWGSHATSSAKEM